MEDKKSEVFGKNETSKYNFNNANSKNGYKYSKLNKIV